MPEVPVRTPYPRYSPGVALPAEPLTGSEGRKIEIPRCPAGLSQRSQTIWKRLHRLYEFQEGERELLALALKHRDLADRVLRAMQKEGHVVETGNDMVRQSPHHKTAIQSGNFFGMALKDLGLRDVVND